MSRAAYIMTWPRADLAACEVLADYIRRHCESVEAASASTRERSIAYNNLIARGVTLADADEVVFADWDVIPTEATDPFWTPDEPVVYCRFPHKRAGFHLTFWRVRRGVLERLYERFDRGLVAPITDRRRERELRCACGSLQAKFIAMDLCPTPAGIAAENGASDFQGRYYCRRRSRP